VAKAEHGWPEKPACPTSAKLPHQCEPIARAHEAPQLLAQRGLADARLTRQHDEGTVTSGSRLEGSTQVPQLSCAADERRGPTRQVITDPCWLG
jgi:hypothetical protein